MQDNDHPTGQHPRDANDAPAAREQLVGARRARQQGLSSRNQNTRIVISGMLIAGALTVFFLFLGPAAVLRLFGVGGDPGQKASQISMKVGDESEAAPRLDFVVPAKAEPEKKDVDPNIAWNEKFKALQEQLADVQRVKGSGASASEIQTLLSRYNDAMAQKFEGERKAMAEENARLREQADAAESARRRAEEAARQQSADLDEQQKLEKKQRESNAVIVDASTEPFAANRGDTMPGGADDNLSKNESFLKSQASSVVQTSVSQKLTSPSQTVVQGTIISAVLETAINTELPGSIRAQVIDPVYSFDGRRILMPSGTILIGQFNNDVDLAQKRILIAWNRAITPSGQSIALGSTGTDTLGRAGTEGNVDNRYGTKFGAAILVSAITALPSMIANHSSSGTSGTTINVGAGSGGGGNGGQFASQMGSQLASSGNGALQQYLSLPPVIRVPQGEEIRVFVNRDLVFR